MISADSITRGQSRRAMLPPGRQKTRSTTASRKGKPLVLRVQLREAPDGAAPSSMTAGTRAGARSRSPARVQHPAARTSLRWSRRRLRARERQELVGGAREEKYFVA